MTGPHHHNHRPHRLSLPSRPIKPYSPFSATPTPTPSKHRRHHHSQSQSHSLSSLTLLLLLSLRSLYSLLPFLRSSSPSFSLFPFSFLVSLLSFLLSLPFSLPHLLPLPLLSRSHISSLLSKSFLLGIVFVLRFQGLKFCGTSASILAEIAGGIVLNKGRGSCRVVYGFVVLGFGVTGLVLSWDRVDCFPFRYGNLGKIGDGNCVRVWTLLLPFMSGVLGSYERDSRNWGSIKELGKKRVRLMSLFLTTVMLAIPAGVSVLVYSGEEGVVSMRGLGWPLANTVVFGVLLSEWYVDEKVVRSEDVEKEFLVSFVCMIVLELVYFPDLSLWGLLVCGLLFWVSIRLMNDRYSGYVEIGMESSESIGVLVMRPVRQILSERKSRKIAMFLMINTGYMVVEFVVGFMSNSLGLISDACHMLFDCAALAIGLYASYISRLPANSQFNYGRGRFEVLSGYANAVFLVLVGAMIVLESLERILDPQEISTSSLLTVSIGGLLVNIIGLVFFHEEHHLAHGGGASCSHSHSHSHSHLGNHDHHHSHVSHGHKHGEHDVCCLENESIKHDGDYADHHDHDQMHDNDKHQNEHGHQQHQHKHDHHQNRHDLDVRQHQHEHDHHRHHEHDHYQHEHDHQHHHHEQVHEYQHEEHDHHSHDHPCMLDDHQHVDLLSSRGSVRDHGKHHLNSNNHTSCANDCPELQTSSERNPQVATKKHQTHHHVDHNMEGIFLHVLADTLGSVGVVISTLLIKYKGWLVADPACSIFISILIVSSVIPLLRNSAEILLQRVPRTHEHDIKLAVDDVLRMKGVSGIQSLHIWSLTNTDVVGTLHLHVSTGTDKFPTKHLISRKLKDAGIKDLTVQVESADSD